MARPPLPRNVKLLGLTSLFNDIASEMIYPLLPQFLLGMLGGNRFYLGVIEGMADSVASLLKLWSGAWSDRAGRRKGFVVAGYTLASAARPMIALATAPWHLFLVRFADRVGKGVRTSARDALIADSAAAEIRGRAFGFQRALDHVGAAIGPVLATAFLLARPGQLRPLFLLALLPGIVVVGLVVFGLREPPVDRPPPQALRLTLKPFPGSFRLFLLALVIFTLGNSSDAFLLVRAGELGIATAWLPIMWSVLHIVKSVGNLLAGPAADRFGCRRMIVLGWMIYAAIYLLFAAATQAWHVWLLFPAYGLFYALTEPAEKVLVARLAGPQYKGLAYGWYNFAIGVSAMPSSLLFGFLYQRFGGLTAFGTGAGLALLAAVLLMGVRPTVQN